MKKAIFTLALSVPLLMCGGNTMYGQEKPYEPFRQGSVWSVNNLKFGTVGDTLIGEVPYMKILMQKELQPFSFDAAQASYWGACRNDTVNRKVYFAVPAGVEVYDAVENRQYVTDADTELLFYDFSISLGDTVACHFFEEDNGHVIRTKVVRVDNGSILAGVSQTGEGIYESIVRYFSDDDSLVSVGETGMARRVIVRDVTHAQETFLWTEGIGSSSGFLSQSDSYLSTCGNFNRLVCYCNAEGECLNTGFDISDDDSTDCFTLGVGVGLNDMRKPQLIVFPSPAHDVIRISGDFLGLRKERVTIYDSMGKTQYDKMAVMPGSIDISFLREGLYILRITTREGFYSCKIIKK